MATPSQLRLGTLSPPLRRLPIYALAAALAVGLFTTDAAAQRRQRPVRSDEVKFDKLLQEVEFDDSEVPVIVEFNDEKDADKLISEEGGRKGKRLGSMRGRTTRMNKRMLRRLARHGAIKRIHIDRPVEAHIARTAATIGAMNVHVQYGYTGAGIGVAVIDSGVTGFHDDLTIANRQGQRVTAFVDFVNGHVAEAYDDWGHGTHVAGIIAGNGYDSLGHRARSIAPGANIIALKALDGEGKGRISYIIAALDWAIANRTAYNIRVINMSLGAGVYESYNTDPLTLAAKRAVDAGIVVVAAAGNMGKAANGQPQYGAITAPGNAPWVLTVGASSTMGTTSIVATTRWRLYSSRGPTMIDFVAKPDLVAPGSGIGVAERTRTACSTPPSRIPGRTGRVRPGLPARISR